MPGSSTGPSTHTGVPKGWLAHCGWGCSARVVGGLCGLDAVSGPCPSWVPSAGWSSVIGYQCHTFGPQDPAAHCAGVYARHASMGQSSGGWCSRAPSPSHYPRAGATSAPVPVHGMWGHRHTAAPEQLSRSFESCPGMSAMDSLMKPSLSVAPWAETMVPPVESYCSS